MSTRLTFSLALVTAGLALAVPARVGAQQFVDAFPRPGAVKLQETELVNYWEVLHDKGFKGPMYKAPLDQITITLTDGSIKFTKPDGTTRIEQVKLGGVRYETKGTTLQEEGMSDIPAREIVLQLKDVAPMKWPVTPGIPGQFPRLDAKMLLENARVRIWDQIWLPNRPVTNHLHYSSTTAVFLSAGKFRTKDVGKPPGNPADRYIGFVLTSSSQISVPHEEEWVSGEPRAIWIEFK